MDLPTPTLTEAEITWRRLRTDAEAAMRRAPRLASLFAGAILDQPSLHAAVGYRLASRLQNDILTLPALAAIFARVTEADPAIVAAFRADMAAILDRDPATERLLEPFLYFKGFHAIQTHRLAHYLWSNGERDLALYLQSRSSEVYQTDIHPAARFGTGILLDHATGLVVGETAVVEDDVSLLQNVTLGGTGKESGDRHPKIRRGVMIGAGAKILGNIEIGHNTRVAAGSVVLRSVGPNVTVAGVPARVVKSSASGEAACQSMDQVLSDLAYDSFAYSI